MSPATATRVVVADDSRLMRRILSGTLTEAGFDVVGEAADGDEALALCERLRPDAMTLDLNMPGTDGMAVLRALRNEEAPATPVVVVSAFSPAHGARAVDALAEGAFDLVAKPAIGDPIAVFSGQLADKLRAAVRSLTRGPAAPGDPPRVAVPARRAACGLRRAVVIACSTGGPRALASLVPALPAPLGGGTLIVQHMPAGFTGSLAARLDRESRLTVREAAGGEALRPGSALLAPGGSHLRVDAQRVVRLSDAPPIGALRPRADLTIADAAALFGRDLLLVVLTGMGKDGLEGARAVRRAGGRILVEAEETCTVYGMPRAVAEAGLADAALPIHELADAIVQEAGA
jgi:two-component system, chemotaxis family, protein-glutamate methylesterase/glutaminase